MSERWEYNTKVSTKNFKKGEPQDVTLFVTKFGYHNLAGPLGCIFVAINNKKLKEFQPSNYSDILSIASYISYCYVEPDKIKLEDNQEDNILLKIAFKHTSELTKNNFFKKRNSKFLFDKDINTKAARFEKFKKNIKHSWNSKESSIMSLTKKISEKWLEKYMKSLEKNYPNYNFSKHLGRSCEEHFSEIKLNGYSSVHRRKLTPLELLGSMDTCLKYVKQDFLFYDDSRILEPSDINTYAGIDEVGVESIAGPMVSSSVILPKRHNITEIPVDSKTLKDPSIKKLAGEINKKAIFICTYSIEGKYVDEFGTDFCSQLLWYACAKKTREYLPNIKIILDGKYTIKNIDNVCAIPKADTNHYNVSSAAIFSKLVCDDVLRDFDKIDARFNFKKHKGYATIEHLLNIEKFGLIKFHRPKMAKRKLDEGYELDELDLSIDDLKSLVIFLSEAYTKHPDLMGDFEKNILYGNKSKILQGIKPSPKVMYYLRKNYNNCINGLNKKGVKTKKRLFEESTRKNHVSSVDSYVEKDVSFLRRKNQNYHGEIHKAEATITILKPEPQQMTNNYNNAVILFNLSTFLTKKRNQTLEKSDQRFLRAIYEEAIKKQTSLTDFEFAVLFDICFNLSRDCCFDKEEDFISIINTQTSYDFSRLNLSQYEMQILYIKHGLKVF